jgi:FhuF 2Fe-2S C-terminal domain
MSTLHRQRVVRADGRAINVVQHRASCCRIYLLPQKELCASCPLVSQEERLERNQAWMKTQLERETTPRAGHG